MSLRLRLHVRRNGLPELNLAFVASLTMGRSSSDAATVANLLEQVNEAVPLTGGNWGLEDYAVELLSSAPSSIPSTPFECLHYETIATIFDKDDEVVIRPLTFDDRRRRRISGRYQIAANGRHLVDGIPFGRTRIQFEIRRPEVALVPAPRDDEDDDVEAEDVETRMITDGTEIDQDQSVLQLLAESKGPARHVHFVNAAPEADDDDEDDEDDEDFKSMDSDEDSSSDSEEDSDDSDSSDSDSEKEDELKTKTLPIMPAKSSSQNSSVSIASPASTVSPTVAPGGGKSATQRRNARRRNKRAYERARESQEADKPAISTPIVTGPPAGHPDHWQSVINYTAVECIDDSYTLQEPSFPFKQQWHGNTNTGGAASTKRKAPASAEMPPPKRLIATEQAATPSSSSGSSSESDSDSDSDFDADVRVKRVVDEQDLPELPADLLTLPALTKDAIVAGMVITWKKWLLSQKTNWQPVIINITAKVLSVTPTDADPANPEIKVVLAVRDRKHELVEREYDAITGERVYGRFELPTGDDEEEEEEEEEEDNGERTFHLDDLVEPRIVQCSDLNP